MKRRVRRPRCLAALSLAALVACTDGARVLTLSGGESDVEVTPPPPDFYAMEHLVQVEIELAPADWEVLRQEGRDLVGVFSRNQIVYDYTYFDATVTIDGARHEHAGVRKKGYWGSLSVVRPSFKIDIDHFSPDASHFGIEKLTLNNDRGDPSRTHECMAYRLFARGGVPAPRCNLAHVVLNGRDLGTYSNVEPIDKTMLARVFSSNDGNLYEGQRSDVTRSDLDWIETETNKKENDRSDLVALADALEADDATVFARLSALVDIDRFRDFWAMELLAGHWDGYSNNANNYMLYHNPETGLFQFMPWGTDNAFEHSNPRGRVYAWGRVASRLYAIPEQQQLFWARFAELNDTVWNTSALLEHIDQVEAMAPDALPRLIADERQFISTRSERVRATLGGTLPRPARRSTSPCEGTVGDIGGTFATVFGDGITPPTRAEFDAWLSLDGEAMTAVTWTGQSNLEKGLPDLVPGVRFSGKVADGREIELQFYVEPSLFQPGSPRFHGGETYGVINTKKDGVVRYVAAIGAGSIELNEAGATLGAPVSGSFTGRIMQFGCAWR